MPNPRFLTTRWSMVLAASDAGEPQAPMALRELCEAYWYPLYAFLRRDGVDEAEAMDLVQGFLAELLGRGELGADRERGRFRSYIIGALRHHRGNVRRAAAAQKRGGDVRTFGIDDAEARYRVESGGGDEPEALFERRWATTVIDRAVERLELEYRDRGRQRVFDALKDVLAVGAVGNYAQKAAALGMTESAVKVSVHRMRTRLRELLRAEVAQTVSSEAEIDDELRQLFAALGR
ncbi:MAG: sigma-70 family RNA polymerase sigma factor [Planctomycetes bacterium]|nr:sigma-70 family RNA polymerase sigma factor [Planctomycetota bacterium]